MTDLPRPAQMLVDTSRQFPGAWKALDRLRALRGREGLPAWPTWCYLPLSATYAYLTGVYGEPLPPVAGSMVSHLGALYAWRCTQGIYRFDGALLEALDLTPPDETIPTDILYALPEWSCYVELPPFPFFDWTVFGFWVHLEWDAGTGRTELRFLLLLNDQTTPLILHFSAEDSTLQACFEAAILESARQAKRVGSDIGAALRAVTSKPAYNLLGRLMTLTLYLCAQNADIHDPRNPFARPYKPGLVRTKRGSLTPPAPGPIFWETGVRIGAALRAAAPQGPPAEEGGRHASPRPHVRRAHWHHFWTGSRATPTDRLRVLHWLPPIPVAMESPADLVSTIHKVTGSPHSD